MNPSQELYTAMLLLLRKHCPEMVFDGELPPDGTPYPFIYLGDTNDIADFMVKSATFGRVSIMVHVWHNNPRKRGDLSMILFRIRALAKLIDTDSYGWCLSDFQEQIVPDNSTKDPLMHGVLNFQFKYWRKI